MTIVAVLTHGSEECEYITKSPVLWVGRDDCCDIRIKTPYIDGTQLALWRHEGQWYVAEVGRPYAAMLNGMSLFPPYRSQPLNIGDIIEMDDYELELRPYEPGPMVEGPTVPGFQLPEGVLEE